VRRPCFIIILIAPSYSNGAALSCVFEIHASVPDRHGAGEATRNSTGDPLTPKDPTMSKHRTLTFAMVRMRHVT
jgi:hypothetical protein